MTVTIEPTSDNYTVKNHNGAEMGMIKRDGNYYWFYIDKEWTPNLSSYQMKEICKFLDKLNEEKQNVT